VLMVALGLVLAVAAYLYHKSTIETVASPDDPEKTNIGSITVQPGPNSPDPQPTDAPTHSRKEIPANQAQLNVIPQVTPTDADSKPDKERVGSGPRPSHTDQTSGKKTSKTSEIVKEISNLLSSLQSRPIKAESRDQIDEQRHQLETEIKELKDNIAVINDRLEAIRKAPDKASEGDNEAAKELKSLKRKTDTELRKRQSSLKKIKEFTIAQKKSPLPVSSQKDTDKE
jgi:hypothetical protein